MLILDKYLIINEDIDKNYVIKIRLLSILNQILRKECIIQGEKLFKLYTTYGLPIDLSIEEFEKSKRYPKFYIEGLRRIFNLLMKKEKDKSRIKTIEKGLI